MRQTAGIPGGLFVGKVDQQIISGDGAAPLTNAGNAHPPIVILRERQRLTSLALLLADDRNPVRK